jgi:hypothetical protein
VADGQFVRPIEVTLGASDGSNTAVSGADLTEGQDVVLGEVVETTQDVTQNPFKPPRRR